MASSTPQPRSTLRQLWPLVLLVLAIALLWALRHRISFDPHAFAGQMRAISPVYVLYGLLAIYSGFILRATRWAILLAPVRRSSTAQLLPSQLIGFTAVALFGRVADLARPYLVARKTETPVTTQLAIYSIERAFDLASAAILFSVTLAFAPADLPHHEAFKRAGILSFAGTAFLVVFALALRFAGDRLAALAGRLLTPLSSKLAATVSARLLDFREGFRTIASFGQFVATLVVSLAIWLGIALTYVASAHAFTAEPALAHFSFTQTMLLLATSMGASLLQLPLLGWFTQIAAMATTYRTFFNVPVEAASACGTLTLITTTLSIIPSGLLAARLSGIGLREATQATTASTQGAQGTEALITPSQKQL